MGKLSDIQIRNWVRAGNPLAVSDGDGLTFTLSKGGTAAWVLRYRYGGKQREKTLGRFPDISLKRARALATEDRAKIQQGVDVAREKQVAIREAISAWTVRQLAENYEAIVLPTKASRTLVAFKQIIRDYILPVIGHLPCRSVTGADVVQLLERAAETSPKRVKPGLTVTNVLFAHAMGKRVVAANPCAGIVASAIVQLPKEPPARVMLTDTEINTVLKAVAAHGRVNELAVRLLLHTGVRIQALVTAEWAHVNFQKREWFIPAGDGRKSSREFVVPMTPTVAGYFEELQKLAGKSAYVFPIRKRMAGGREGDVPMTPQAINQVLWKLCEAHPEVRKFSPHDLRSTFRSHLGALGVPVAIAERCLNHSLGGLIAVYDQHDYLPERLKALELWDTKLASIEAEANNVVPLRGMAA